MSRLRLLLREHRVAVNSVELDGSSGKSII